MNRKAMARYAALAIAYANVNKPDNAAFFATLWLKELGLTARDLQNGACPDKYADEFGAKIIPLVAQA